MSEESDSALLALVIEDDPDAAAIYSKALETAGFEVESADTGDKALERLDVIAPALVILDMYLPRVAGREILDYIRTCEHLSETQIIIITGDQKLADDPIFQRGRVIQILVKPVTYTALRDLAQLIRISLIGG